MSLDAVFSEDDLIPISALAQASYCERRWALIHLEGLWEENRFTAEGRRLHERTDEPKTAVRGDVRTARALRLQSLRLGLSGVADAVEFHRLTDQQVARGEPTCGVDLEGVEGLWRPFPVEYKRGRPKVKPVDEVQLCAQALCLEEMLGVVVAEGALFYVRPRRRFPVVFDAALRERTEALATRLHVLAATGVTPRAHYERTKCERCSLLPVCLPKATDGRQRASRYLARAFHEAGTEESS